MHTLVISRYLIHEVTVFLPLLSIGAAGINKPFIAALIYIICFDNILEHVLVIYYFNSIFE